MKRYLFFILILFIAVSCLDDKTNYDYTDINNFDDGYFVEGISSKYSLFLGESVTLTPTVKLSMDTLNPDINYSWVLDGVEVSTEPSYTYNAEKYGVYNLVFLAIDKKTGVGFPTDIELQVSPLYKYGWLFLSRTASGDSRLSMITGKKSLVSYWNGSYMATRDSLVYTGFHTNLGESLLGSGPIRLVEEFPYEGENEILEESEIMVLQESGPIELGGTDFAYTGNPLLEFSGGTPNLKVRDAVLGWCSKWLLSEDNQLYFSVASVLSDLHSGRYNIDPAFNGEKYKELVPVLKSGDKYKDANLVIDMNNKMWALCDYGSTNYTLGGDIIDPLHYIGAKAGLADRYQQGFDMSIFQGTFNGKYIQHLFVAPDLYYMSLLKKDGQYMWHKFSLGSYYGYDGKRDIAVEETSTGALASEMFTDFKESDLVIGPRTKATWLFVASGNKIYGTVMDWKKTGSTLQESKEFFTTSSNIVSIKTRKFMNSYNNYIHMGILLEDGTFQILEVNYDSKAREFTTKEIYNQNLKSLDPEISEIVDVIHKHGTGYNRENGYLN